MQASPKLPLRVFSTAQLRVIEQRARALVASEAGASLMQRAATAAWQALLRRWPKAKSVHVLAGPGNNGGDGYLLARLARAEGVAVMVWSVGLPSEASDAAQACAEYLEAGGSVSAYCESALDAANADTVIVDALFGIGLSRALTGNAARAVMACHQARERGAGVLAMDIPSGLHAETGVPMGAVVRADVTVTFMAHKLGLFTAMGPDYCGELVLDDLALPSSLLDASVALGRLLSPADLARALPPRARDSHKGRHGHVLIIGGDHGMAGAVLLAARAALRAGAGLVSVATRSVHCAALVAAQPEVMFHGVEDVEGLHPLLARASTIAIGPGLGTGAWGQALWAAVKDREHLIADADALNLLADNPSANPLRIITPHPGEAAGLLGMTTAAVQRDRLATVKALSAAYGGVAVLKGAGTLVHCQPKDLLICSYGNPGMAVAGMGDALTGVIAALLSQGLFEQDAAAIGVLAHALAGDLAAVEGERGLLPSDLIQCLRRVVNPIEQAASN